MYLRTAKKKWKNYLKEEKKPIKLSKAVQFSVKCRKQKNESKKKHLKNKRWAFLFQEREGKTTLRKEKRTKLIKKSSAFFDQSN